MEKIPQCVIDLLATVTITDAESYLYNMRSFSQMKRNGSSFVLIPYSKITYFFQITFAGWIVAQG